MKKKISISDIAKQLNVAKSTVSFILNGKAKEKRISDALTDKILKYVEEKGYKPSELARSLSTGKTKIICLMVEKISDYFFSHVAFHLEELAYKNGYKIIYCSTENNILKTKGLINTMRDRYVDGYVITPTIGIETEIKELMDSNIPVVLFDRYLPTLQTDYVVLNNYKSTFDAVCFLAEKSKNIAFITLESGQTQMEDRLSGYKDAIEQAKLNSLVLKTAFKNKAEKTLIEIVEFLKDNENIDAIIFATNYLAISGIQAINQLKLKFPEDISVIAFDDHDLFRTYKPTITAIVQPLDEMAKQLFNTLLDKLNNKVPLSNLKQIVVSSELKLREST